MRRAGSAVVGMPKRSASSNAVLLTKEVLVKSIALKEPFVSGLTPTGALVRLAMAASIAVAFVYTAARQPVICKPAHSPMCGE